MKTIYYHYGTVSGCGQLNFPTNATLAEIALKIGDNAIITKVIIDAD